MWRDYTAGWEAGEREREVGGSFSFYKGVINVSEVIVEVLVLGVI